MHGKATCFLPESRGGYRALSSFSLGTCRLRGSLRAKTLQARLPPLLSFSPPTPFPLRWISFTRDKAATLGDRLYHAGPGELCYFARARTGPWPRPCSQAHCPTAGVMSSQIQAGSTKCTVTFPFRPENRYQSVQKGLQHERHSLFAARLPPRTD